MARRHPTHDDGADRTRAVPRGAGPRVQPPPRDRSPPTIDRARLANWLGPVWSRRGTVRRPRTTDWPWVGVNTDPSAEPRTAMTHRRAKSGERPSRRPWTLDEVRRLGMTTDLETAAEVIGIGRTLAYDLAKRGAFPVRMLRLGRRVLVPVPDLLAFLGADPGRSTADGLRRDRGGRRGRRSPSLLECAAGPATRPRRARRYSQARAFGARPAQLRHSHWSEACCDPTDRSRPAPTSP